VAVPVCAPVPEVAKLRLRMASLQRASTLLEGERKGSQAAIKIFVARLHNAGRSIDYCRQHGE
jgi:hypothetical protein